MTKTNLTLTAPPPKPSSGERPFEALEIAIDQLQVSARNPKARSIADPELTASIAELGILQPLVVRRANEDEASGAPWMLLAGHRRLAAARAAGLARVPCAVLDRDGIDGAVLLAENMVRRDLHPLEEAAVVREIAVDLKSQEAIAKALGRSVRWVARRQALADLAGPIQKATRDAKHYLSEWPVAWLEELALLAPAAQQRVTGVGTKREDAGDLSFIGSIEELQAEIAREVMPLRLAPWAIDDADLVPSVGPCTTCPKTTSARPTLFGDGEPIELAKAACTDAVCWLGKLKTFTAARLKEARREHGKDLLLIDRSKVGQAETDSVVAGERWGAMQRLVGGEVKQGCGYAPANEKTGKPALVVDGHGVGQVVYVREKKADAIGVAGQRARKPARPKAEVEEARRRRQHLEALGVAAHAFIEPLFDAETVAALLTACAEIARRGEEAHDTMANDVAALLRMQVGFGDWCGIDLPQLRKYDGWPKAGSDGAIAIAAALVSAGVIKTAARAASNLARAIPIPAMDDLDPVRFEWLAERVGFKAEVVEEQAAPAKKPKAAKAARRAPKGGA